MNKKILMLIGSLGICSACFALEGFLVKVENSRTVVGWNTYLGVVRYYSDAVGQYRTAWIDVYPGMVREVKVTDGGNFITQSVKADSAAYDGEAYFWNYRDVSNFTSYVRAYGTQWTAPELYNELSSVIPTSDGPYSQTQISPKRATTWVSGTYSWP